jgi:hypothetical protein
LDTSSDAPKCTYTRMSPQPTKGSITYRPGRPGQDGAIYEVRCEGGRTVWMWLPDGAAPGAPAIDPAVVARRAVDQMELKGPDIASPRAAGRYLVGMPMWVWVRPGPTTYGPASVSASAGGMTVTATARVTAIRWDMGDGTTVTCTGPGTPYRASAGAAASPDCGHRYTRTSADKPRARYTVTATSTWTITWRVQGTETNTGWWTETRTSTRPVAVGEAQVLN